MARSIKAKLRRRGKVNPLRYQWHITPKPATKNKTPKAQK